MNPSACSLFIRKQSRERCKTATWESW